MYTRNPKNRRLQLHQTHKISWLIFMASVVGQLGIDLYTPSMPSMQTFFATSATNIKLTLSLYLLGAAVFSLPAGFLADRYGRRPTLLVGYALFIISTLLILNTQSIAWVLVLRFIEGAIVAISGVVLRASYRDLYSGTELTKMAAILSSTWGLVPILAPMFGGYIQHYFGWHMQFQSLLILGGASAIISWKLLPEIATQENKLPLKQFISALYATCTNSRLMLFALITSISAAPVMSYIAFAPFLLQTQLHIPPIQFGWLAFLVAIFYMLGSLFTAAVVNRVGNQRLLTSMTLLSIMLAIVFLGSSLILNLSVLTLIAPNILLFFALGAIYPTSASLSYHAIKQNTGVAAAVIGTVLILFNGIIMTIVAWLPHTSPLPLAWLSAICIVIMSGLVWISR